MRAACLSALGRSRAFVIGETGKLHYSYSWAPRWDSSRGLAVLGQMVATVGLDGTIQHDLGRGLQEEKKKRPRRRGIVGQKRSRFWDEKG